MRTHAVLALLVVGLMASVAHGDPPNLYELRGANIKVRYATTGIDGNPRLTVTQGKQVKSFVADQIRTQNSELGTLVTVTLEAVPDLRTTVLTLLVPPVNLPASRVGTIDTQAIIAVHKTSIGGPALVQGQVVGYRPLVLQGSARAVVF